MPADAILRCSALQTAAHKNNICHKEKGYLHMSANKLRFNVCGTDYVITTTDTEEYVLSLAEKLDEDMSAVMEATPSASTATAAVITALDYLDEMKKTQDGAANMRAQIKDYLEDTAKSKLAAEEARAETEAAGREIERLRKEVTYLRQQIAAFQAKRGASMQQNAAQAAQNGQPLTPQQTAQLAAQRARQQQLARTVAAQQAAAGMQPAEAPAVLQDEKTADDVQQDGISPTIEFESLNEK